MEREISVAVEIGVTLIALSVVISIIWFTVYLGNTMANDVTIENIKIYANQDVNLDNPTTSAGTSKNFYGNYHNVKIGRGIIQCQSYL